MNKRRIRNSINLLSFNDGFKLIFPMDYSVSGPLNNRLRGKTLGQVADMQLNSTQGVNKRTVLFYGFEDNAAFICNRFDYQFNEEGA